MGNNAKVGQRNGRKKPTYVPLRLRIKYGTALAKNPKGMKELARKTKIDPKLLSSYKRRVEKGQQMYEKAGNRLLCDQEHQDDIVKQIDDAIVRKRGYGKRGLKKLFKKGTQESQRKLGVHFSREISDRTQRRYQQKNNITMKNAETKTDARLNAEFDLRNAFSQIIMWFSVLFFVNKLCCIINYDATQFEFGKANKMAKVATTANTKRSKTRPFATSSEESSMELNYHVKYYCICNAAGRLCPTWVFLVADGQMSPDEHLVYPVMGLSQVENEFGYICFCKSRAGNAKFYDWLNKTVVAGFIKMIKRDENLSDDEKFFINCDGEHVQILPYMNASVTNIFNDLNAIIGKVCASCTAVAQPLDAYIVFKGIKAALNGLCDDDYRLTQLGLMQSIQDAISAHRKATRRPNGIEKRRLPPALLSIRYAIVNTVKPKYVVDSFKTIGLNTDCSVNIDQFLSQFNVNLSPYDYEDLVGKLTWATKIFKKNGQLKDAQFLEFNAVKKYAAMNNELDRKAKDDLVLPRQRCVILNHNGTIQRFQERIAAKKQEELDKQQAKETRKAERERNEALKEQNRTDKQAN